LGVSPYNGLANSACPLPVSDHFRLADIHQLRANPVSLQNPCAPGPSGDIALQESGEVIRAWRQLFPSKADPREVHIHYGIDQPAHHNFAISAGGQHERRDDGNALARLYHSDHGVLKIKFGSSRNNKPGASHMLVDKLLDHVARRQGKQPLFLQSGPGSRGAAQCWVVIRTNHDQGKAKQRRPADSGCRLKECTQAHVQFAVHNEPREDIDKYATDWSRDGKYILYTQDRDLWFVTTSPEPKSSLFLKAPSVLRNGQFSPDGKWVAYASNETGKWQIYVTSFPEARGRWQISTGGGEQPRWRGDGKELFYLSSDEKMMAVPVTTGMNFDAGTPGALFQATPRQPIPSYELFVYDVSRDGQRFLINTQINQPETAPMSVLLNWPAKLNK
jgi:hypothetical protein